MCRHWRRPGIPGGYFGVGSIGIRRLAAGMGGHGQRGGSPGGGFVGAMRADLGRISCQASGSARSSLPVSASRNVVSVIGLTKNSSKPAASARARNAY